MVEEAVVRAASSTTLAELKIIVKKLVAIIPSKTDSFVLANES
jgi:hypothetical protein